MATSWTRALGVAAPLLAWSLLCHTMRITCSATPPQPTHRCPPWERGHCRRRTSFPPFSGRRALCRDDRKSRSLSALMTTLDIAAIALRRGPIGIAHHVDVRVAIPRPPPDRAGRVIKVITYSAERRQVVREHNGNICMHLSWMTLTENAA